MGATDESGELAEMSAQAAVQPLGPRPVSLELDGPSGADRVVLSIGIGLAIEGVLGRLPAPVVGAALPATG